MRELELDAPVSALTVAELEELIERIIAQREARQKASTLSEKRRADPASIAAVHALRGSARGEHLLEQLLADRAEERARER